jgi:hypothetical protein
MRLLRLLLLAALAPLASCGYHLGYPARPGLRTIAVPIAENLTFRRELEFPLTEQIVREIQRRTPLIIRDRGVADATLLVTLTQFKEAVLVEGPNFQVLEKTGAIYVDVRLVAHDGRVLVGSLAEPAHIVETAEFPVQTPDTSVTTVTTNTFARIAQRVVMLLEAPLGTPPEGASPRSKPR